MVSIKCTKVSIKCTEVSIKCTFLVKYGIYKPKCPE